MGNFCRDSEHESSGESEEASSDESETESEGESETESESDENPKTDTTLDVRKLQTSLYVQFLIYHICTHTFLNIEFCIKCETFL